MGQESRLPPRSEELRAYSLGKCAPERAREIEAFLANRPECGSILGTAADDALVRHLRGAGELPHEPSSCGTARADSPSAWPTAGPPGGAGLLPVLPGYEILGELGRGGMGIVYRARQVELNRVVALKIILGDRLADRAALARFRTEAEAVARLQHPNIVQIHEVGEHNGWPFFSLEFCPGGSLDQ
jgi:serine/threonine-protein kinase